MGISGRHVMFMLMITPRLPPPFISGGGVFLLLFFDTYVRQSHQIKLTVSKKKKKAVYRLVLTILRFP